MAPRSAPSAPAWLASRAIRDTTWSPYRRVMPAPYAPRWEPRSPPASPPAAVPNTGTIDPSAEPTAVPSAPPRDAPSCSDRPNTRFFESFEAPRSAFSAITFEAAHLFFAACHSNADSPPLSPCALSPALTNSSSRMSRASRNARLRILSPALFASKLIFSSRNLRIRCISLCETVPVFLYSDRYSSRSATIPLRVPPSMPRLAPGPSVVRASARRGAEISASMRSAAVRRLGSFAASPAAASSKRFKMASIWSPAAVFSLGAVSAMSSRDIVAPRSSPAAARRSFSINSGSIAWASLVSFSSFFCARSDVPTRDETLCLSAIVAYNSAVDFPVVSIPICCAVRFASSSFPIRSIASTSPFEAAPRKPRIFSFAASKSDRPSAALAPAPASPATFPATASPSRAAPSPTASAILLTSFSRAATPKLVAPSLIDVPTF